MIKFTILALIAGGLIVMDYRGSRLLPIRTGLKMLAYPLQYAVDVPYKVAHSTKEFFTEHERLSADNRELRALVGVYAARDQKYYSIAQENLRLRKQLDATPAVREKFTLAEILSVSSNPFSKDVVINKGSNDDIFVGQVVLSDNNIYGQVKSVTPNSAVVIQLTDAKHAIHVRNSRTGLSALAVGTGKINLLELKHIETSMDVQTGDVFVSSGLGQLYPPDFPVAVVNSVAYNPGDSFMRVTAHSLADFTKTREVLLIWRADYSMEIIHQNTNNKAKANTDNNIAKRKNKKKKAKK